MDPKENLIRILDNIPPHVKAVAVSKTKPVETILDVYTQGYRIFGENKVQELTAKHPQLPDDIEWHYIGHLQRNKVKQIVGFVHMIESIDSLRLLKEVEKQAKKADRVIDCLLQFHIASEETKFGLDLEEGKELLQSEDYQTFQHIRLCGIMGMGTFTDEEEVVRNEFRNLKQIFDHLKSEFFSHEDIFKEISMGMSGDYHIAIEEGSTIVRIGSAIFGARI